MCCSAHNHCRPAYRLVQQVSVQQGFGTGAGLGAISGIRPGALGTPGSTGFGKVGIRGLGSTLGTEMPRISILGRMSLFEHFSSEPGESQ